MSDLQENKNLIKLAEQYFRSDQYFLAENILKQIIDIDPSHSKANEFLAYIYGNQGDTELAFKLLKLACSREDCSPAALYYLGSYQLARALYDEAIENLQKSILKGGEFFEALHDLGTSYAQVGNLHDALSCYQKCLTLRSDSYELFFNISRLFDELKCFDEALAHYDRAISLKPDYAEAWSNKGVTLGALKRFDEALAHYDRAISLKPDYAEAWSNKGVTLGALKRFDEALAHYDRAISLKPDYAEACWNKSLISLLLGDFKKGWNLYEFRWKKDDAEPYRHPQLNSLTSLENIQNKNILVWQDQGFGDAIQFARYVPMLTELGANVTFEVLKPLVSLFKNQLGCEVTFDIDKNRSFDFEIPLQTLPRLFGTTLNNIPKSKPLKADTLKVNLWKNKLKLSHTRLNIGLALSGNRNQANDHNRSMPLKEIESWVKMHRLYVIQKDLRIADEEFLAQHQEITYLGDQIEDFSDTAAIIENLDLIISVCTSTIHLAGSLNKKAYLALSWTPDWRWLLESSSSPWYPSIKIFRQESMGNWQSVVNQMNTELQK